VVDANQGGFTAQIGRKILDMRDRVAIGVVMSFNLW